MNRATQYNKIRKAVKKLLKKGEDPVLLTKEIERITIQLGEESIHPRTSCNISIK
jgi:hypothetical protein